jgi:hypothetical protein
MANGTYCTPAYSGNGRYNSLGNQMGTISTNPYQSLSNTVTITSASQGLHGYNTPTLTASVLSPLTPSQIKSFTQNINGGNVNTGFYAQTLDSILNSHYSKYEVYEFKEDALALGCAWYRIRNIRKKNDIPTSINLNIYKLTDKDLTDSLNNDDRILADTIRDYYSKKIMMWKLKGIKLTNFREDLNKFIHGDQHKIKETFFPIIFRLPEFYEYDANLDKMREQLTSTPDSKEIENYIGKQSCLRLTPLVSLVKNNKRIKVVEYWFKTNNNIPVMLSIEPKNPLEHIWNKIFDSKKVLQISGHIFVKSMTDFEYLSIKNWNLVD